jgi:hypothetical protein
VQPKHKGIREVKWPRARGRRGNPDFYLMKTRRDDNVDAYEDEYEEESNVKIIDGVRQDGTIILKELTPKDEEVS